jgi:hypothetical protein
MALVLRIGGWRGGSQWKTFCVLWRFLLLMVLYLCRYDTNNEELLSWWELIVNNLKSRRFKFLMSAAFYFIFVMLLSFGKLSFHIQSLAATFFFVSYWLALIVGKFFSAAIKYNSNNSTSPYWYIESLKGTDQLHAPSLLFQSVTPCVFLYCSILNHWNLPLHRSNQQFSQNLYGHWEPRRLVLGMCVSKLTVGTKT